MVRNTYGLMDTTNVDVTDCDTLLKEIRYDYRRDTEIDGVSGV